MFWFIVILAAILLLFVVIAKRLSPATVSINGKHVIITGGSSGIGKAMAILAAKQGASVTILARNMLKLEEAKTEIQKYTWSDRKVHCISVDLSGDYKVVEQAIREAEDRCGPVFMLVNSAGTSISRTFQDLQPEEFKRLMELNYYGSVNATKAAIPSMVKRKGGRIIYLSSQAGQIGLFGFTAYSASKFALRGMAEALQMEMTPHNVRVTVAFPPDTDTPGYQQELEGKPKETTLISQTAGLLKAEDVASTILQDSLAGTFTSYQGMDGWLLANISAGMSPATSLTDVVVQFFLMGLLRVVGLFYLASFDNIVLKCQRERENDKKSS